MSKSNENIAPKVGMPATYSPYSDCYPCTVVEVSKSGKTITVQMDDYRVCAGSAYDGSAKYEIVRNESGPKSSFSLRKNGRWVRVGDTAKSGCRVYLGFARRHYDPHF